MKIQSLHYNIFILIFLFRIFGEDCSITKFTMSPNTQYFSDYTDISDALPIDIKDSIDIRPGNCLYRTRRF